MSAENGRKELKVNEEISIDWPVKISDPLKLNLVLKLCEAAGINSATAQDFILADWSEGEEHYEWLNNAPAQEIASWVIAGNR